MPKENDAPQIVVQADGGGRYIISCPAEMEWDARLDIVSALKSAIDVAGAARLSSVILDMDNVKYMNSAGLSAIFSLRKYAKSAGAKIAAACPNAAMQRLFKTVNMSALVPVTQTLDEARKLVD